MFRAQGHEIIWTLEGDELRLSHGDAEEQLAIFEKLGKFRLWNGLYEALIKAGGIPLQNSARAA